MKHKLKRCFVSVKIPNALKDCCERTQQEIKEGNLVDAKYTQRNNLHLTLKFLGEIDDETIQSVSERLEKIKFSKFDVSLNGAGTFLQEGEVKIIWHALGGEDLMNLQKEVDNTLQELFPPEKRFMAHITLARVKQTTKKKELDETLKSLHYDGKKYEIDRFFLMESTPADEGSTYTEIKEYSSRI